MGYYTGAYIAMLALLLLEITLALFQFLPTPSIYLTALGLIDLTLILSLFDR